MGKFWSKNGNATCDKIHKQLRSLFSTVERECEKNFYISGGQGYTPPLRRQCRLLQKDGKAQPWWQTCEHHGMSFLSGQTNYLARGTNLTEFPKFPSAMWVPRSPSSMTSDSYLSDLSAPQSPGTQISLRAEDSELHRAYIFDHKCCSLELLSQARSRKVTIGDLWIVWSTQNHGVWRREVLVVGVRVCVRGGVEVEGVASDLKHISFV